MLPPQLAKSHLPNLSQDVGIRTTCRNGLMLPTIFVGQKWIGTLDEVQLHAEFVKEIVSE